MLKRHKDFLVNKKKRATKIANNKIVSYKKAGEKIIKAASGK